MPRTRTAIELHPRTQVFANIIKYAIITHVQHTKTLSVLAVTSLLLGMATLSHVNAKATPDAPQLRDSLTRTAERLQQRIEGRYGKKPGIPALKNAISTRRAMFAHSLMVALQDEDTGEVVDSWEITLAEHPEWMAFDFQHEARFYLDKDVIAHALKTNPPEGLETPSFATVTGTHDDGKVLRATVDGTVADGHTYDADELVDTVVESFEKGKTLAAFPVKNVEGAILYNDGTQTLVLHRLGVGRSEFHTSPWGRKQNVRKAMNEKANGVLIPQGSTFSFNATLGGPVTYSNGWYDSLIIVNGKDLEPAPGGGICQGATTVYRAAMSAGLPIATRKSHSLYVTYYKQFGVGMDATVFPGKQDMRFENDTPGPMILVGSTDDADNAYSTLYGIDDGRSVSLEGPYFGSVHKDPVLGRALRGNEVAWVQRVTAADGTVREDLQVAQYSQLPKSVALEFEPVTHAAADLVADAR